MYSSWELMTISEKAKQQEELENQEKKVEETPKEEVMYYLKQRISM